MICLKRFRALLPKPEIVQEFVCPPYDVIETEEARVWARKKDNFIHVIRSEVDFPRDEHPYQEKIYQQAKKNLKRYEEQGLLVQEETAGFYLYRQIKNGKIQNGIVACVDIANHEQGKIKRHELTREEKEKDRILHFATCEAHTEPVFLFYREQAVLRAWIHSFMESHTPLYDFDTSDRVRQIFWKVEKEEDLSYIEQCFEEIPCLYIADGHHRTASAVHLKEKMKEKELQGADRFPAVIFEGGDLTVLPYNRVIRDWNGLTEETFLERIGQDFDIDPLEKVEYPEEKGGYTMLTKKGQYRLSLKKDKKCRLDPQDIVRNLDVSVLQNYILDPVLGISDPRTDARIEFYGGEESLKKIQDRLLQEMEVAFLMYPTDVEEIIGVSERNEIMPPKSTWFEPKLLSGLFIHKMEDTVL